jgi:hypothetical protein
MDLSRGCLPTAAAFFLPATRVILDAAGMRELPRA